MDQFERKPGSETEPGAPEQPESADAYSQPDPSKPMEGESYADYLHRLDRERARTEEAEAPGRQEYWNGIRDFGRGHLGEPNYGPIPEEYRMNGMSKAAFICGILSLVTILFNGSLFFGALGILFAFLSRKKKFSRQARTALWLSAAGIFAFALMIIYSVATLVSSGIWGKMVDMVRNMDPNNPNAVAEIQQEILDEILEHYGMQYPSSSTGKRSEAEAVPEEARPQAARPETYGTAPNLAGAAQEARISLPDFHPDFRGAESLQMNCI